MTTGDVEQLTRDVRLGRGGPPIIWTQMVEDPSPRRPPSGGAAEEDLELPVGLGPAWRALGRAGQVAAVVVAIAIAFVRIVLAAAEGHDRTVTERISVTAPPVTVTRTVTAPAAPATP